MSPPKPRPGAGQGRERGLKGPAIGSMLLVGLGVTVLLLALFAGRTSPRGWIPQNYTRVAPGTYQAQDPPLRVASRITSRFKTEHRVYTPGGIFLRYHNAVVAILPSGRGSRITVDDPDRGYARYHSSVGGAWGGPGGRASSFRGGGPGEGK
ncbi:lipoprotein [Actinomadura sp. NBRC 104412]|uniref:DUF4247 domain-containing protein n=1 Tax=Actinomadura sp. NBRC 104412 TaxID=3032203 RepID=UPI0024A1DED6|nr:DUF4247 domain-containing protein [Actinomadura sp. NBRC 104412]GLZ07049.1 lipoprotein [Actinomadura sp. NBRC 104412]